MIVLLPCQNILFTFLGVLFYSLILFRSNQLFIEEDPNHPAMS